MRPEKGRPFRSRTQAMRATQVLSTRSVGVPCRVGGRRSEFLLEFAIPFDGLWRLIFGSTSGWWGHLVRVGQRGMVRRTFRWVMLGVGIKKWANHGERMIGHGKGKGSVSEGGIRGDGKLAGE